MLDAIEPLRILSIDWNNVPLSIQYLDRGDGPVFLYLHGWGHDHTAFLPLLDNLAEAGRHVALDFPGFGQSSPPPSGWGVSDYAEFINFFLDKLDIQSTLLIGHSFGGRVGFHLCHRWPNRVKGLFLIASAGLRKKVPLLRRLRIQTIRSLARGAKRCLPGSLGENIKQLLYDKIASRDYKQAGEMRQTFVKVIQDDVSTLLPNITQPVVLLYGSDDTETPPDMGKRMQELLPQSEYIEIPGFDHYSILSRGRHQVGHHIQRFASQLLSNRQERSD